MSADTTEVRGRWTITHRTTKGEDEVLAYEFDAWAPVDYLREGRMGVHLTVCVGSIFSVGHFEASATVITVPPKARTHYTIDASNLNSSDRAELEAMYREVMGYLVRWEPRLLGANVVEGGLTP